MKSLDHDLDSLDVATGLLFQFLKKPSTWATISAKVDNRINRTSAMIVKTIILHPSPLLTVTKLANIIGVEAPSISRMIDELEKLDLVRRVQRTQDKRTVYLEATAKAQKLNEQLNLARRSFSKAVLENWTDKDRQTFIKLYERYVSELTGESSK